MRALPCQARTELYTDRAYDAQDRIHYGPLARGDVTEQRHEAKHNFRNTSFRPTVTGATRSHWSNLVTRKLCDPYRENADTKSMESLHYHQEQRSRVRMEGSAGAYSLREAALPLYSHSRSALSLDCSAVIRCASWLHCLTLYSCLANELIEALRAVF